MFKVSCQTSTELIAFILKLFQASIFTGSYGLTHLLIRSPTTDPTWNGKGGLFCLCGMPEAISSYKRNITHKAAINIVKQCIAIN